MRTSDVREIVEAARVDPTYFSLEGDRHEALCLLAEGQTWKVFLSEQGQRHEDETQYRASDMAAHLGKKVGKRTRQSDYSQAR